MYVRRGKTGAPCRLLGFEIEALWMLHAAGTCSSSEIPRSVSHLERILSLGVGRGAYIWFVLAWRIAVWLTFALQCPCVRYDRWKKNRSLDHLLCLLWVLMFFSSLEGLNFSAAVVNVCSSSLCVWRNSRATDNCLMPLSSDWITVWGNNLQSSSVQHCSAVVVAAGALGSSMD